MGNEEALAGNDALEKFPVAVVLQLADNEETEIRERLAKNPGITTFADVLEKLAIDDDDSVRRSFALPRLQPQADQSTIQ